jgi:hypothetical protein
MLIEKPEVLAPTYTCPEHGVVLEIGSGLAACTYEHAYPIVDGVPRFVSSGYTESFGRQWQRFRLTQLDSHTGLPLSEERLRRCLGWQGEAGAQLTKGKAILEAGCGAGRFTEVLLSTASRKKVSKF